MDAVSDQGTARTLVVGALLGAGLTLIIVGFVVGAVSPVGVLGMFAVILGGRLEYGRPRRHRLDPSANKSPQRP
jgi:hypothetical protein